MLESEEALVPLAHVVRPVVNRGAVGGRSQHHVEHDLGHVYLLTSREWLFLSRLVVAMFWTRDDSSDFFLLKKAVTRFCRLNYSHASLER